MKKNPDESGLHPSSFILHPSFFSRWRNAILGTLLVLAGIGAALITVMARRTNEPGLTMTAAIISLVIAGLMLIFIVPPLARSARLEILRLDIPFSVTTGGAIFLVIVVVVGFAAWNTGNNLLFLVLSLLVSAVFVGWMAARASLRDLVVSARFPDHIFAGEPAPVIVTLRNLKRVMPSFSTFIEARGPMATPNGEKKKRRRWSKRSLAYFTYVPHAAAAEQRVEQLFAKRGHVVIDGFELSTRFPFGFFRRRRRLRARDVDIVVYPKPEAIGDELHLLPMAAGRMASLRRGPGHDLFALRDYQPQDDLRHVDWKATARTRRLTVREFTSEDERRITVILDPRAANDDQTEKFAATFERGVTLASSLVNHFIEERAEVRLILGAESGKYGSGLEHLYDCLRRLALVTPEQTAVDFFSSIAKHETSSPSKRDIGGDFAILLTAAAPGSIPSRVWRSSHVIYL
jgi:uncharacterized protein (DUF58 family)